MATLTVEDRLEIHELYSRYSHAFDSGDVDAWVALFIPEGRFGVPAGPITGTDGLRRFATERAEQAPGMRHLITNVTLDATGGGANGRAYFLCFRLAGDGRLRLLNIGRYEDELVKTDDGWRFAARDVVGEVPDAIRDAPFQFAV